MKYLYTLILILCYSFSIGQDELKVIDVIQSECDKSVDICRIQPRIIKQENKDSIYTITIGTVANCLGISLVKANYNFDTLFISYREGKVKLDTIIKGNKKEVLESISLASCRCCFEFQFYIENIPKTPVNIIVNNKEILYHKNKYKIYPVTFDIVKGDTINLSDKYGFKQGKWNTIKDKDDMRYSYYSLYDSVFYDAFFKNDTVVTSSLNTYYSNGNLAISSVTNYKYNFKEEKYLENGNLSFFKMGKAYPLDFVSVSYYESGVIKEVNVKKLSFFEYLHYFENGELKEIRNKYIWKKFYSNGSLKIERFNSQREDNIKTKYYYDNGNVMSIYFVEKEKDGINTKRIWNKYYDINSNEVTKDYLIKKGFKDILEL